MSSLRYSSWRLLVALVGLAGLPLPCLASAVSFQAALDIATRDAPQIAAQNAKIDAARAAAIPAGALPDPKLLLGTLNYPVAGGEAWHLDRDPMTMRSIGLMQDVPNAAKRKARADIALAAVSRGEAERLITLRTIRSKTAQAWIRRYFLEREVGLFDELTQENQLLNEAVRARLAGGRGNTADAVLPQQEAALLEERRDRYVRDLTMATAALRHWIGPEADQALDGKPLLYQVGRNDLLSQLDRTPTLLIYTPMTAMAQAEIREADAARKPDWGVELDYQHRAPIFGDMISVQFNLSLPIFQSTRQTPRIMAKRADLARLDANRLATRRDLQQTLDDGLAEYVRLDRAVTRQRDEFIPLAQQKVELLMAAYRAGTADLPTVLGARREWIDARFKAIDLARQRCELAARLHFAYGDDNQ